MNTLMPIQSLKNWRPRANHLTFDLLVTKD
jgi:hypothetical protein